METKEFRQDIVSGEWVLFSTGRAKRPHVGQEHQHVQQSKEQCPFEDLTQQKIIWKDSGVTVIENKYPAVQSGVCGPDKKVGPVLTHGAVGEHDILVFNDHDLQLHAFTPELMLLAVRAYKKRARELEDQGECTKYVMIFHNFGDEAGASIWHPHSQILAMPIIPPSVQRSVLGAQRFYDEHERKVHGVLMDWELQEQKRIVVENDSFVAYCPFASRKQGEIRIVPKNAQAFFIHSSEGEDMQLASVLSSVLQRMSRALAEPAFNFYIHSAPVGESDADVYYTWHIEIVPKVKVDGGFELGTGIDINTIDPDAFAQQLRAA